MVLKERVWETREVTQKVIVSEEVIGCDNCQKEIGERGSGLDLTVFKPDHSDADHFTYCCWACVSEGVSKIEGAEFATLPYLHFADEYKGGQHVDDFVKLCGK